MLTVIETKAFIDKAKGLLTDDQRNSVIDIISDNPEAGSIMPGTNGVRKLRIPLQDRGKSGGARVIYYYFNETKPIFLLGLFAKNEKDNVTKSERNELQKLTKVLIGKYTG